MSASAPPDTLWCRFCHEETKQWVDELNDHIRVCLMCWRRQKDGERITIGERDPAPRERPSTLPPPPPVPCNDNGITDRIAALESRVSQLEQGAAVYGAQAHRHVLYK